MTQRDEALMRRFDQILMEASKLDDEGQEFFEKALMIVANKKNDPHTYREFQKALGIDNK